MNFDPYSGNAYCHEYGHWYTHKMIKYVKIMLLQKVKKTTTYKMMIDNTAITVLQ